jgi:hypothetical protein
LGHQETGWQVFRQRAVTTRRRCLAVDNVDRYIFLRNNISSCLSSQPGD